MELSQISKQYTVRKLTADDAEQVCALEAGNPLYFEFCPPAATVDSVLEDMQALPPDMTYDDKFYIGFFQNEQLVAVMDLILHYPDADTAFVGFFMMDQACQGKGIGSSIVGDTMHFLNEAGFIRVRLGVMKGNEQSRHFWLKNKFLPTGEEADHGLGVVAVMQKQI